MKRVAVLLGLSLAALGLLGASSGATSQPLAGNLDPTFGNDGVVAGPAGAIAIQPDGKVVVLSSGSIVRYLPNGSPDSSFGKAGHAATAFRPAAVALQTDGKIVVVGTADTGRSDVTTEFAVSRYRPDGSPDTSFGTNGTTETVIPEQPDPYCPAFAQFWSNASAVDILPSGGILVAGTATRSGCDALGSSPSFFALAEYRSDGSLDPAFGQGGIVQTDFSTQYGNSGTDSQLAGIAVQPDGKIVASGSSGLGGHGSDISTIALTRYNPDGSPDTGFGLIMTSPKRHYEGGPPILEHGQILVAGARCRSWPCGYTSTRYVSVLARYDAHGSGEGITPITDAVSRLPTAIVRQSDGKILVAENYGASNQPQGGSSVARLLPNGRLDASFGRGGFVPFGNEVSALALQTDGKILAGGATLSRLIGGDNCVVPVLHGKTVRKASAGLQTSYCRRGHISKRFSSRVARGRVISSKPPRGTRLPGGSTVGLVVSKGKRS